MNEISSNSLIIGLRSLDKSEQKLFRDWLTSPYCNRQPRLLVLYDFLLGFAPDYDAASLTAEACFQAIFAGEAFAPQRLREQFSFLYRQLKQFWIHQELQQTEDTDILLLRQMRKRKLNRAFATEARALDKRLSQASPLSFDHYWTQYQLSWEQTQLDAQQGKRSEAQALPLAMEQLDLWYSLQKLKGTNELLNRQRILRSKHPIASIQPLLAQIERSAKPLPSLLQAYYLVNQLLESGKENDFKRLVQWLTDQQQQLPSHEVRALYKHAQNYCIRQINEGRKRFEAALFQLYQDQLTSGVMLENGFLLHTDFKNIVTVGLRQGEIEWVSHFMERFHNQVAAPHQDNVYNVCRVSLSVANGQISEAIRMLQQVKFSDVYYQLTAKHLLLSCYYQAKDWEMIPFTIASFQAFLQRNQEISSQNRLNHLNFLKLFRRLFRLSERQHFLNEADWKKRSLQLQQKL
ncbi:MAG: hypothetical protein AAFQ87_09285, partial [Bacteroidota bacterium]